MNMDDGGRLIALASSRISGEEAGLAIGLIDAALKQGGGSQPAPDFLDLARSGAHSTALNALALYIHRVARDLSSSGSAATRAPLARALLHVREQLLASASRQRPAAAGAEEDPGQAAEEPMTIELGIRRVYERILRRTPGPAEIEIWKENFRNGLPFHEFLLLMERGPEAKGAGKPPQPLPDKSDGEFIQTVYEVVLTRGAAPAEVEAWQNRLASGLTRQQVLEGLFATAAAFFSAHADEAVHDGLSALIMGTRVHVTAEEWQNQALVLSEQPPKPREERFRHSFQVRGEPRVLVSALASMYRGGEFIEQFMDNITSLDGFDDYCELVIVDADSPENEYETIKRYFARHKNINYIRCNYRLGIYDAWNVAAKAARGQYLTNTNMDDLRRHDSFMQQAGTLEALKFVDVVYQDLFYTFDPRLSYDEIARFGLMTALPVVTPHNMIQFNSPHNAPMWRKSLHDEIGYFNTHYRSAGDYDFWLRCLEAGKKFYKINSPHVVYYQNPKGLSTRPDTRGVIESMEITRAHCRKLTPDDVVVSREEFLRRLDPAAPGLLYDGFQDRYLLVQQGLRNAARTRKYASVQGGSAS
jgi:glycosyltransferase involved in cell wall biosynthesis